MGGRRGSSRDLKASLMINGIRGRDENNRVRAMARAFGLPMPRFLLPSTRAFETVDEAGRFVFDVLITLPFGGELVHYRGWLQPQRLEYRT